MILIDLKPKETEVCDCMMASLTNAAIYFKKDFQYLFKGIWVFNFRPKDKENDSLFWKRLYMPGFLDNHDQLRIYHGVKLITQTNYSYADFLKVVKTELTANKPLIVEFNAYYCPWAGVYRQADLIHYCLITGLDEEKNELICVDPYVTTEIVRFPIEELEQGYNHFYTFELVEPEGDVSTWKEDLEIMVRYNLTKRYDMDAFEMIRCFADEVLNSDEFIAAMREQNNLYSYELFYQLKYMTHSRLNYAWLLEYIANKCGVIELEQIIEKLKEASSIWRIVWLKFTKLAYLDNKVLSDKIIKDVYNKLLKIADLEESAAHGILKIVS